MTKVSLADISDPRIESQIWELLCECDTEFIPPLSCRNGPLCSSLRSESRTAKPTSYFQAIKRQVFVTAEVEGAFAGFLSFINGYWDDNLKGRCPSNHVTTICVTSKYRGRGVAVCLYDFLINELPVSLRCPFISTRTWNTNESHLNILDSLGFELVTILQNHRAPEINTLYLARKQATQG